MSDERPVSIIEGRQAYADAALEIVSKARREVCIASQSLERDVFGTPSFADAMKTFLIQGRMTQARFLVRQPQLAVRECERLIELLRRLSDSTELHQPLAEAAAQFECEWIIADGRAFVAKNSPRDLEARYGPDAPLDGRDLHSQFEKLWHLSEASSELRPLRL